MKVERRVADASFCVANGPVYVALLIFALPDYFINARSLRMDNATIVHYPFHIAHYSLPTHAHS